MLKEQEEKREERGEEKAVTQINREAGDKRELESSVNIPWDNSSVVVQRCKSWISRQNRSLVAYLVSVTSSAIEVKALVGEERASIYKRERKIRGRRVKLSRAGTQEVTGDAKDFIPQRKVERKLSNSLLARGPCFEWRAFVYWWVGPRCLDDIYFLDVIIFVLHLMLTMETSIHLDFRFLSKSCVSSWEGRIWVKIDPFSKERLSIVTWFRVKLPPRILPWVNSNNLNVKAKDNFTDFIKKHRDFFSSTEEWKSDI